MPQVSHTSSLAFVAGLLVPPRVPPSPALVGRIPEGSKQKWKKASMEKCMRDKLKHISQDKVLPGTVMLLVVSENKAL
jgi:hypothetical protein